MYNPFSTIQKKSYDEPIRTSAVSIISINETNNKTKAIYISIQGHSIVSYHDRLFMHSPNSFFSSLLILVPICQIPIHITLYSNSNSATKYLFRHECCQDCKSIFCTISLNMTLAGAPSAPFIHSGEQNSSYSSAVTECKSKPSAITIPAPNKIR